jgi:hypothetical protein
MKATQMLSSIGYCMMENTCFKLVKKLSSENLCIFMNGFGDYDGCLKHELQFSYFGFLGAIPVCVGSCCRGSSCHFEGSSTVISPLKHHPIKNPRSLSSPWKQSSQCSYICKLLYS